VAEPGATYAPGAIVRARGREWVVLPEPARDWLLLRPLGGTDREVAGLYLPLEGADVGQATFDLPDPGHPGDHRSCRLLRDAARLGVRAGAGPFRSFGRVAVEPRPYQLVPLLMALRQEPVRLLIADDVGVGKTVEAGLVARELLDRGEAARLAVLCPPHLAGQWQAELAEKFHLEAEVVLPGTVGRLERPAAVGESLFDLYGTVVVSVDFIKSERYRHEFLQRCPELVIVDEAHTCAAGAGEAGPRQQRHRLVAELARDRRRHLILVTATPHSGNEGAFRALLALLKPELGELPEDLAGAHNEHHRRELARYFVQRRRADVRRFMTTDSVFPDREEAEATYSLAPPYRQLLEQVLAYARERVADESGTRFQQRVRWWSALALLRSLASSPAAAAATLRARSASATDSQDTAEADVLGERAVLDLDDSEAGEFPDAAPGGLEEADGAPRERLWRYARAAEALAGPEQDAKLARATVVVRELLAEGYHPILFCRFIPTATYAAGELRAALKGVEVAAVTGLLPPAERERRVAALAEHPRRVLVATDCLSEGINLQHAFDAVVHYDLSWNPTRHEQREGRVDRYGQPRPTVKTVTLYGTDNLIDGLVLDVLIRKHRKIRAALGVSVPVPASTTDVIEALMSGLLLRDLPPEPAQLALFDLGGETTAALHGRWERAAEREKVSRALFAQRGLAVEEVVREWAAVRAAIGTHVDVARFVAAALAAHGGTLAARGDGVEVRLPPGAALREALGAPPATFRARFEPPVADGAILLGRTHPLVEGLASYVLDTALDPLQDGVARRCGAIRTDAVDRRTTLLLVRFRHHIVTRRSEGETAVLAEECQVVGFRGTPEQAEWLSPDEAETLLDAEPVANLAREQITGLVRRVVDGYGHVEPALAEAARARAAELLAAHRRVRQAGGRGGVREDVVPNLPPDVLGVFVLLPAVHGAGEYSSE
jgi:superfamily II DNA or RNA helicase